MTIAERVPAALTTHPAVKAVELAGSRAEGRATDVSDWDFLVATDRFEDLVADLPGLVAELEPLAQQWDRLSPSWCYMLILRGPVKVDLIFRTSRISTNRRGGRTRTTSQRSTRISGIGCSG
jgi:hypothetical protein